MNALERYNKQDKDGSKQMQYPIKTRNGLYVWELWTFKNNKIYISYFAEGVDGGNIIKISIEDYIYLIKN
jgi:hypothetical protein